MNTNFNLRMHKNELKYKACLVYFIKNSIQLKGSSLFHIFLILSIESNLDVAHSQMRSKYIRKYTSVNCPSLVFNWNNCL